jgi:hypothetical protein
MADPRQSRGYRNRNPGNIDHVPANRWQGLADPPIEPAPPGGRARFCRFVSHEYGIRALAMLLTTYQDRHGLRTIQGIVSRWAPGVENNTAAYVRHVCELTGRRPADILDLHAYEDLRPLVVAIITHELGGNPYAPPTIDGGLRLAGVVPAGRPAVARTGTARAAAGTAAAGVAAVSVVQPVVDAVAQAAPALHVLQGLAPWLAVAVILAVAGFFIWQRTKRVA